MKTESNIKPSVRLEIEAFPKREGAACTVILYDNIEGPLERQAASEGESAQEYFRYDRFEIKTRYRENLAESVEASFDSWLQQAKDAEEAGAELTEIEALQKEVKMLKSEKDDLSSVVDDLIIASLGGDDLNV